METGTNLQNFLNFWNDIFAILKEKSRKLGFFVFAYFKLLFPGVSMFFLYLGLN